MKDMFYICEHCGNIIAMIKDSGIPIQCCGEDMQKVTPGTTEASGEKHIPVYKTEGDIVTVSVGAADHPMMPEHYIEWICVETKDGFSFKKLKPDMSPKAKFLIPKTEKIKAVYAFCNQHSLWKSE